MKVAIMQPYFFPYIGYFQLINEVDKFVFYDDVAFIKQGWINRNNVLVNGSACLISVPVKNISSFSLINNTEISYKPEWTDKLIRSFEFSYKRSPYFNDVFPMIEEVISARPAYISELSKLSVQSVLSYLSIEKKIVPSSAVYGNSDLKSQERVIDICKKEGAGVYINPIGGVSLYSKDEFEKNNMQLQFIKTGEVHYNQYKNKFVALLSILDVLMFNSPSETKELLIKRELL